jgi:hypothetical protein
MKWVFILALLGLAASMAQASTPVKPKAHTPKPVAKGKTSVTAARASSHQGRYAKGRVSRRAPAPNYQARPDPERYQEIQKALADRGYFKTEPNGQWDTDSVDALKRFQADQRLDMDGKINARTLVGLGLGPKHDRSAVASAPSVGPATAVPPPPEAPQDTNPQ